MNCWTSKCLREVKCNKQVSITQRDQRSLTDSILLTSFAVGYFYIMKKCNNLNHILRSQDAIPKLPLQTILSIQTVCTIMWENSMTGNEKIFALQAWQLWYNGTEVTGERWVSWTAVSKRIILPDCQQCDVSPLWWGTNKGEETFYSENKFILVSKRNMPTY